MELAHEYVNDAFPAIHTIIFIFGVSTNIGLLLASFYRTPKILDTYSIMIKVGSLNDLVAICCDFFTMQRILAFPGNLHYLSHGPCSLISTRSCYFAYCIQLCTLVYSLYVMAASFAYRLWILHRPSPSTRSVLIIHDATVTSACACDGHAGLTTYILLTVAFIALTPGPAYHIMVLRHKILAELRKSDKTRKMHRNLVQALTVHAMLPPITTIAVVIYLIMAFDIYHHPALEKIILVLGGISTSLASLCTIYYVEPYRQFVLCRSQVDSSFATSVEMKSTASRKITRSKQ